jgi:hypothetical protein
MKSTVILYLLCFLTLSAWGSQMEEQVLEVSTVNGAILSDPILALSVGNDVYLPLLDIGKVLGVRIEQPSDAVFKVYSTESEFELLDFTNCASSPTPACKMLLVQKGFYYLNTNFLKETLQWPITADLKSMQLVVNIGAKPQENFTKQTDDQEHPYTITRKKFGYPAARIEATLSSEPSNNILNLYETQPLLNHDSDILISTTEQDTSLRWTISKEIVESTDPYELKNYELISTQTLDTKNVFSPAQVTGFNLSNVRSGENIFDTQNLYEKGPPRWKVELYVNEIYLGETTVDLNGNFSFLDVPIFYGQNKIHYRLTSPLGKVVEVDRMLNVSSDFQGRGRIKYQAAFGQVTNSSRYQGSAIINYGVTSYISTQIGYAQFAMPSTTLDKRYSLVGVNYLQPYFSLGALKIASFDNLENSWTFTPKANVGPVLLTGEYSTFDNFKTLLINTHEGDELTAIRKVSLLAPLRWVYPLTTQFAYQESEFAKMEPSQQIQARVYAMFPDSSLLLESNKFWPSTARPDLYVEYGKYSRSFRGKYGVLIQNDLYAKTKVEIEYLLQNDLYLTLSSESPPNIRESSVVLGANKLIGELQAEANIAYSERQTIYSLTLSTNIKTNESGYKLSQEENYRQANVELFAYVDENSNGKHDLGEKPYRRLRILETHRQKEYETNDEGLVVVPALSPYQRVSFQVVKESISNIFLTAQDFQSDFILTPAQQLRIEIPIKPSFDVRGTIHNHYFKKLIPLEMVDEKNQVVSTTISASSGKYKFSDLPGGTYFIRVNPDFIKANQLHCDPESIAIDLTGKAGVRNAVDIELWGN